MGITTVADLINFLSRFKGETPVVKSNPTGPGYFDVNLIESMVFTVAADGMRDGFSYYQDAHEKSDNAGPDFDAVVL